MLIIPLRTLTRIDLLPRSYNKISNGTIKWIQVIAIMHKELIKWMTGLPMIQIKTSKSKCTIRHAAGIEDLVKQILSAWLEIRVKSKMDLHIRYGGKMLTPITGSRKTSRLTTKGHWKELWQAIWNKKNQNLTLL